MSIWDEFQEGFVNATNDIRHTVIEEPYFGRATSGDIEAQIATANIEVAAEPAVIDLTGTDNDWGRDISSPQIEAPTIEPMER